MRPGGLLREVVVGGIFLASAGNVFVYTVKAYRATWHRPPLKAWQTGQGLFGGQGDGEKKGKKGKGPELPEQLLEGAGEALEKLSPIPLP